ncbi:Glycogen synthase, ADP-glucose transglucosylase (EC [Olavius algarvensis Delta 1 endosymbiont]|nr:Glycogen synthase, ADP-glucose transglucosylase (EC [Olavius algarvensis Delta 1 endosymbiont]
MKILYVSSEITPFAKTGGLADVAQALPGALKALGHDIRTVMPKYLSVADQRLAMASVQPFTVQMHNGLHHAVAWSAENGSVPTYFIENDAYFNREGYYGEGGKDYPDNLERFVFFCKSAIECCKAMNFLPDVIHCNDWQTALLPAILESTYWAYRRDPFFQPLPKLIYTIHNISYQGRFSQDQWSILSLPRSYYSHDFEFYGQINLTKSAIHLSDAITTVSATYAREIQTTDFGFGLQDVLQRQKDNLFVILNGVDYGEWSPETDPHTYGIHYSADDLSGKPQIKTRLQREYGLPERDDVPLFGMITRLVEQKGIDLITECAERILQRDTQMIVLGSGDRRYHDFFEWLRRSYPDRVGIYIGYNNELAHKIEAGADIFLMPSLFEPCGLNQIYSLKYGTLPIVRLTGGLADTIQDGVNGFTFFDFNTDAFLDTVHRAIEAYRHHRDKWKKMMTTGMGQNFSWQTSAEKYLAVYNNLLAIDA